MKELISVIVPVYNAQQYLVRCVESLLSQTYSRLEIILIDDGSTDESGKICDDFAKLDSRVITKHTSNSGVASTRNKGLSIANGNYIGFLDCDDSVQSDMYEIMLSRMQNLNCDTAECDYNSFFLLSDNNRKKINKPEIKELIFFDNILKNCLERDFVPYIWSMLIKADLARSVKFSCMKTKEDEIYKAEILSLSKGYVKINKPLYNYLERRKNSLSDKSYESAIDDLILLDNFWKSVSKKNKNLNQAINKRRLLNFFLSYKGDHSSKVVEKHEKYLSNLKNVSQNLLCEGYLSPFIEVLQDKGKSWLVFGTGFLSKMAFKHLDFYGHDILNFIETADYFVPNTSFLNVDIKKLDEINFDDNSPSIVISALKDRSRKRMYDQATKLGAKNIYILGSLELAYFLKNWID